MEKVTIKKPRGVPFRVVRAMVLTLLVVAAIGVSLVPYFLNKQREGNASEAYRNVRSFGLALYGFKGEWGAYPNEETRKMLLEEFLDEVVGVELGIESTNDFFRQIIVAGYVDLESPFWANINGARKPDNDARGKNMLASGECGFSYVVWESDVKFAEKAPLVMTPLVKGERSFDREPFGKRAVVLYTDSSVVMHDIDRDGRVMVNGMNFFDPKNPHWSGETPRVVWPE